MGEWEASLKKSKPRKSRKGAVAGATIGDVAKRAGVSTMTVSRVVNGTVTVRPETRARVLDAVARLAYRPNAAARSLAASRTYFIGLVYDNPSAGYINELITGLMSGCRRHGYHLAMEKCTEETSGRRKLLLTSADVDGVVLPPPVCDDPDILLALSKAGVVYVRLAPDTDPERSPSVVIDDHAAARDMTRCLLRLGHRRIGFIKGDLVQGASRLRYGGFVEGLAEAGRVPDPRHVAQGYFSYRSGFEAASKILSARQKPTAIFASNDDMAAGAIAAAAHFDLAVPEMLSVAGFDDTSIATTIWPQLTTVHQPIAEMADAATDLLVAALRDGPDSEASHARRLLDYAIIERESVAPARVRKARPGKN